MFHTPYTEKGGMEMLGSFPSPHYAVCIRLSVHHPDFIDGSRDMMLIKLTFKCTVQAQASGKKGKIQPVKIILVKGRKGI
jgi:hypothetical protein